MAAQFLTTSKLNNIVNMISLGRQSGILRVVRGQGQAREVGQIKFLGGEPISALLGQLTGQNALAVLLNWGECVYSFDEHAALDGNDPDFMADGGRPSADSGAISPPSGATSGSWPTYGYNPSGPASSWPRSPASSRPGFGGSQPGQHADAGSNQDRSAFGSGSLRPNASSLIPRRSMLADHVDLLPLDRRERMILLLLDGKRQLPDLARLTRRDERDVFAVLDHLASLGLVEFS